MLQTWISIPLYSLPGYALPEYALPFGAGEVAVTTSPQHYHTLKGPNQISYTLKGPNQTSYTLKGPQ